MAREPDFTMLPPVDSDGPGVGAFRVPDGVDPATIPDRLKAALAAAFGGDDTERTPSPDPATDIARLVEMCQRYVAHYGLQQCVDAPFRVGTLVTPIAGCGTTGAGEPHIVLEVRTCEPDFTQTNEVHPYSNGWGNRRNIRVGAVARKPGRENYTAYWVESYEFTEFQQS